MIYLDNAATSWPKPENVYRTMDEFLRTGGGNPGRGGHSMAAEASKVVEDVRLLLTRLLNAPNKYRVVFTYNCTDSLNTGLKGLLNPGDHVITSCIEHNSVVRPLRKLEQKGVRVTRIHPRPGNTFVSPEDIEKAITGETKLVVMTHASNVNGVIQPLREYGITARNHNLVFMVDAAQTAGRYSLDVQANNIDLLAFSGHKGPLGPTGIGVLYISERVNLDSSREGGTGSQSELEEQPDVLPNKFECGTLNTVGIAGMGAGLDYILSEGMEKILSHELYLTSLLSDGLSRNKKVTVYCVADKNMQAPIISFTSDGIEPGEMAVILDQSFDIKVRAGLHCAPAAHKTLGTFPKGTVRLSPGYFNTAEEIDFTLQAIEKITNA
ncbi:aminotransferase class V-fold PLP-dependent enzyme [Chloroflexota bacterium]